VSIAGCRFTVATNGHVLAMNWAIYNFLLERQPVSEQKADEMHVSPSYRQCECYRHGIKSLAQSIFQ
jgi:hypothetical protein